MISDEQVRHVAKLARIELREEQVPAFAARLSKVFEYMEVLNEVDVSGVQETSQVTGLKNVMEADEIMPSQSNREELLACTELPVDTHQIRVNKAIE